MTPFYLYTAVAVACGISSVEIHPTSTSVPLKLCNWRYIFLLYFYLNWMITINVVVVKQFARCFHKLHVHILH